MANQLDPRIPLGYAPVQYDFIRSMGSIGELQQQRQARQLNALSIALKQQELEQQRKAINDQEAINRAYQDSLTVAPDGTASIDQNKLTQALSMRGYGSTIPKILQGIADFQKSGLELSKARNDLAAKQADYGGLVGNVMKSANYDPDLFLLKANQALQGKVLPPEIVQPYIDAIRAAQTQDPTGRLAREKVQLISDQLIAGSPEQQKLINETLTAQSRAQSSQIAGKRLELETPGIQSENTRKQIVASQMQQYGMSLQDRQTLEQRVFEENKRLEQQNIQNRFEQTRIGIAKAEQNLRQRTFDSTYGALVDPVTGKPMDADAARAVALQDPAAVAVANYQVGPPAIASRGPGAALMRKVLAINPQYNALNWQGQRETVSDFGPKGKSGKALIATNTALGHMNVLLDAIDALNNGDIRILNAIGNRLNIETGDKAVPAFKAIVSRVAPELAAAYGEATGGEREHEKENYDPNLSPDVIKNNVAIAAKLLAGKIYNSRFAWEAMMGDRQLPMISPESSRVLDRLGLGEAAGGQRVTTGPGGLRDNATPPTGGGTAGTTPASTPGTTSRQFLVKAPDGNTYPFPTKEAADQFVKITGGQLVTGR